MNYESMYIIQALLVFLFIWTVNCLIVEYKFETVCVFAKTRRLALKIIGYKHDTFLGKEDINAYDRYEMWRYIEKRR